MAVLYDYVFLCSDTLGNLQQKVDSYALQGYRVVCICEMNFQQTGYAVPVIVMELRGG